MKTDSLRIWRSHDAGADDDFDEMLDADSVYTDRELARIVASGFNAIWIFCRLYHLMDSSIWPQLNVAGTRERIASIQAVIDRASKHGLGVYLYFNEPAGVHEDHPFWQGHTDLRGDYHWRRYSLCASTPEVKRFFEDAIQSIFTKLRRAAGVILITAGEDITDCWSKHNRQQGEEPPACPRCRDREPSEIVLDHLRAWTRVSAQQPEPFRILAWNWEWAYWYADPQREIVEHLPDGVELLADMEIGGTKQWRDRLCHVGEYSLSYVGPSPRLVGGAKICAARDMSVHAKIELNVTHELCTVPNVPVIPTLHGKFKAMSDLNLSGCMAAWNMGTRDTLNTAAFALYMDDPNRYADPIAFQMDLAKQYFGEVDTSLVLDTWHTFVDAFALYPQTVQLIYTGPHNDAFARPLVLQFKGEPIGVSYKAGMYGDDLSKCLTRHHNQQTSFTCEEVADAFSDMACRWIPAAHRYAQALQNDTVASPIHRQHRFEESSCATIIGLQLRSIAHQFQFQQRRTEIMRAENLTAPCQLPPDEQLLSIMREELTVVRQALPLVEADSRLGFHQTFQGYKYDSQSIIAKIELMEKALAVTSQHG